MKSIIYSIIAIMMASMLYSAIPAFLPQDANVNTHQTLTDQNGTQHQKFFHEDEESESKSFGFFETFSRAEIIEKLDKNDVLF